jgi:hypothetical protein
MSTDNFDMCHASQPVYSKKMAADEGSRQRKSG